MPNYDLTATVSFSILDVPDIKTARNIVHRTINLDTNGTVLSIDAKEKEEDA